MREEKASLGFRKLCHGNLFLVDIVIFGRTMSKLDDKISRHKWLGSSLSYFQTQEIKYGGVDTQCWGDELDCFFPARHFCGFRWIMLMKHLNPRKQKRHMNKTDIAQKNNNKGKLKINQIYWGWVGNSYPSDFVHSTLLFPSGCHYLSLIVRGGNIVSSKHNMLLQQPCPPFLYENIQRESTQFNSSIILKTELSSILSGLCPS